MRILSPLTDCFSSRKESKSSDIESGQVALCDTKPGCIFCSVDRAFGFDVILEEKNVIVFRDRDPTAREHLLAIPINHINSVKELNSRDLPLGNVHADYLMAHNDFKPLVRELENAGNRALDSLSVYFPPNMRRLGFHIPPATSVGHLHLHVQGLPYKSVYRNWKYPVVQGSNDKTKAFSWFVEISQAKIILEKGGKIGILPC